MNNYFLVMRFFSCGGGQLRYLICENSMLDLADPQQLHEAFSTLCASWGVDPSRLIEDFMFTILKALLNPNAGATASVAPATEDRRP